MAELLLLLLCGAVPIFGSTQVYPFSPDRTKLSAVLRPTAEPTRPEARSVSETLTPSYGAASVAAGAKASRKQHAVVPNATGGTPTRNTLETLVQSYRVPQDVVQQQAGEGHRKKKKEKESRKPSRRAGRHSLKNSKDVEKARRPEGGKANKQEKGKKKSKDLKSKQSKDKGRSKLQKEEKAKEKKPKEEKSKVHAKHLKTATLPKRTRKASKRAPAAPAVPLPPAPPPPTVKARETKAGTEVPLPAPAEEKPPSMPPEKAEKDAKGAVPIVPTIAFVGRRVRKAPPSRLQQDLDALCTKHFRTLCRAQDGHGPFCQATTAVARLILDPRSADARRDWRCYEGAIADAEVYGMRCVDECGGEVRCAGKLKKNMLVSEPLTELTKFVDRRKWIYCSSFQYAANALCNFNKAGNVARYDPHRARWMCLDPVDIALESTGYCADNCGSTIPCAGGVMPGDTPARTVYIVHSENIAEAFAALQPCKGPDEVCVATPLNPPKCVASGSPGAIVRLSHQQAALNELCQREVDNLCRIGRWDKHCFEQWLARREETGVACFPRQALDFTELSRCFDGCNEAPCPGRPHSPHVPRVVPSGLADIAKNPFYCSPYQAAGNKYCVTHKGPNYVARQHNVTREWKCFKNDIMPPKGWNGCANNCGAFTVCASDSAGADPTVQEDHELEYTVRSTPAPCLAGEECESTPLNPPYCSQTRPNPQPVVTSPAEIQRELGCTDEGSAAARSTSTDSRLAAYGPVAHLSTLAWIRSKSGQ